MMNNPRSDVLGEARWAAANGFDLLDLTVEGPRADLPQIDGRALRKLVRDHDLAVVGHTGWYLPFDSPVRGIRRAANDCVAETFPLFAALGAQWVNVHIGTGPGAYPLEDRLAWQAEAFAELHARAQQHGLGVMAEHPPKPRIGVAEVRAILDAAPGVGFHLDIAHAHVGGQRCDELIAAFAPRIAHVHLSDNKLTHDDHLPLGCGLVDWKRALKHLHAAGYDRTLTLEVFSGDRDLLLFSARKVRDYWQRLGAVRVAAGG